MSIGLKRGEVAVENHKIDWETSAKIIIDLLKNIMKNDRIAYTNGKSKLIEDILKSAALWKKSNYKM